MSRPSSPLLVVQDLVTEFVTRNGSVRAVDGIGFHLNRGEILGFVGESGSGKSVAGLSIMGLVAYPGRILRGSILFEGRDLLQIDAESMRQLRGRRIAMIFQDPMMTLNPTLRIETQMVETILAHESISWEIARARALEALEKVGITSPESRLRAYPHQLSGGMRQRVAIAIAFLMKPDLIIADEPTTALDVTIQAQILHQVQKLCRESGTAMIWVSHDLSVVSELTDRVAVLYAGQIIEEGTTEDVIRRPRHPYSRGLLDSVRSRSRRGTALRGMAEGTPVASRSGCRFRLRCPQAQDICAEPPPRVRPTGEATVLCHFPLDDELWSAAAQIQLPEEDPAADIGKPVLELINVSKTFSAPRDRLSRLVGFFRPTPGQETVFAVNDVSLTVGQGEVVGLVGESGCGKSTVARIAAGIIAPDAGEVRQPARTAADCEGLGCQMIFQDPLSSLNPRHRVSRIVGEAARVHGLVAPSQVEEFVSGLLTKVGLDPAFADRLPHQFSGGQRQRIGIARALAVNPELLICDEAVSALDVSVQAQIINLFVRLRKEMGLSILFISHDLGVVRHISDRILVMYLGKIVEAGPAEQLFNSPNHPYTQALIGGMPSLEKGRAAYQMPKGELPSPFNPPSGCHYHTRCPFAHERCRVEAPPLKTIGSGRLSACHLNDHQTDLAA